MGFLAPLPPPLSVSGSSGFAKDSLKLTPEPRSFIVSELKELFGCPGEEALGDEKEEARREQGHKIEVSKRRRRWFCCSWFVRRWLVWMCTGTVPVAVAAAPAAGIVPGSDRQTDEEEWQELKLLKPRTEAVEVVRGATWVSGYVVVVLPPLHVVVVIIVAGAIMHEFGSDPCGGRWTGGLGETEWNGIAE